MNDNLAGPLFSLDAPASRLHHTDAQYVESIVTDAGRLGFEHPIADANFYPNWGKYFWVRNFCAFFLVKNFQALHSLDVVSI